MQPYYQDEYITLFHGDCREILPTLPQAGAVVTDPPYLTKETRVPIRGNGVAERNNDTVAVGMPWGFSLEWVSWCGTPDHWIVFGNYQMLGALCAALPPSTIFVWRKSNAPRMTRPVPRLDCEFIVWSRSKDSNCERMGEFSSMVLDVPTPQAGCMATERFTHDGGKAVHPCQKPLAVILPFIDRLGDKVFLDPFAGTGTTLVAAKALGRRAIGIEKEEEYCELIVCRMAQEPLLLGV